MTTPNHTSVGSPEDEPTNPAPETYLNLSETAPADRKDDYLFWSPKEPDRIRLTIGDPRFTEIDGTRPGLQMVFSSNPKSADYSPSNFNRARRAMVAAGVLAPPQDVPEHRRHLRYRDAVIKEILGIDAHLTPASTPPNGVPSTAQVCKKCWCYVADLPEHTQAAHS